MSKYFLVLFLFTLSTAFAQKFDHAKFSRKSRLASEILTRELTRKFLNDILNAELKDYGTTNVDGTFKPARIVNISETQLMQLMDQNPKLLDEVESYLKEVPRDADLASPKMEAVREKWKTKFTEILSDPEVKQTFADANNPFKPYEIHPDVGYSDAKVYVNHERLENGKILSKEQLIKAKLDYIKGARKELSINITSDDSAALIKEIFKAKKAYGISIEVTINKKGFADKKQLNSFLSAFKQEKIIVKTAGFNPDKVLSVDWSISKKGKAILSDGFSMKSFDIKQPDDLIKVWVDVIDAAKKDIWLNIFDFDLQEVADALVRAQKRGVKVNVGIDGGVITHRPEVNLVYEKLVKGKVNVHAVKSVGLNHPKMMAVDSSVPDAGRVLYSEGNLTQSCIGCEGDLKHIPAKDRPVFSKPNANSTITLKSDALSKVVAEEVKETVVLKLEGEKLPRGGIFRVWGGPKSMGSERPYIDLAFSPNGAHDNINANFIVRFIDETEGPLKVSTFAWSSKPSQLAIENRAKKDVLKNGKFVLQSVSDPPFGVIDWSVPLNMSGVELIRPEDKTIKPKYAELTESELKKILGDKEFAVLRSRFRLADTKIYGNKHFKLDGVDHKVTAKNHHKLWISGNEGAREALYGSFNPSAGAEKNQEYILRIKDPKILKPLEGAADYLYLQSNTSVHEEALARNLRRHGIDDYIPADVDIDDPVFRYTKPELKKAPASVNAVEVEDVVNKMVKKKVKVKCNPLTDVLNAM